MTEADHKPVRLPGVPILAADIDQKPGRAHGLDLGHAHTNIYETYNINMRGRRATKAGKWLTYVFGRLSNMTRASHRSCPEAWSAHGPFKCPQKTEIAFSITLSDSVHIEFERIWNTLLRIPCGDLVGTAAMMCYTSSVAVRVPQCRRPQTSFNLEAASSVRLIWVGGGWGGGEYGYACVCRGRSG